MIFTARQLEDLHKTGGVKGHVVLPYRARLTPLAADWVRAKKISIGYSDGEFQKSDAPPAAKISASAGSAAIVASPVVAATSLAAPGIAPTGGILWWCDGPCGPAKAALVALERESSLRPMLLPQDRKWIVAVVKEIAGDVKAGRSSAAVLMVQNAASAMVYANRCPSLRAVVGTCLEAVEQGLREVAANVLVIEHPYKTLPQVRNMLLRFIRGPRTLSDETRRQIEEMSQCS